MIPNTIKTVVFGAGRMAQGVLAELQENSQFELVAVVSRNAPIELLAEATDDLNWLSALDFIDSEVDLVIDFTLPGGPATAASWCQQHKVALISGTTALNDDDKQALESAAEQVPVLWASNMSRGVALISALACQAAAALGDDADITISDTHHQHKQDAPSGTALSLAEAIMKGHEGGEVAFISVRKGEVIGDHTISYELPGEIVEISHQAKDRSVFAKGALSAAAWLIQQTPGYYSPSDWLNIG